jgi:GH35 family endo-1,4-beta-xylanase
MSTKIEKESLEAHVELCSERYSTLHDKFDAVNERLDKHEGMLSEIRTAVVTNDQNRTKQVIKWGAGTIAVLASALGAVVFIVLRL